MTVKTFGSITHHLDPAKRINYWTIEAQPDVMMRLKRIFPRVQASHIGSITIKDSEEVCRDLEWVIDRWPMIISAEDLSYLRHGAQAHRETGEQVTQILAGKAAHAELPMKPAREPRAYQKIAHDMVEATGSLLLADELGLGKSMQGLLPLSDPQNRPMLAVVLNGLQKQWLGELKKTFPDLTGVEATKSKPYDLSVDGVEPDLIVMNYAKLAGWADHLAGKVSSVVFDEVQELRRDNSQKHHAATQVAHHARRVIGLSATPVYNFGGEMYSILSVLNPGVVGDRTEFSREWCSNPHGMDRKTRITDPAAFRRWMTDQGVFLRRTREEVGIQMPPLSVQEYPVDVDDQRWQELLETSDVAKIAELILSDNVSHQERWRASGDFDWKMRHATGVAKAPGVAAVARLILESEEKIILAGWHREVWRIWQEALAEYHPVLYTGTESTAAKHRSFQQFVEGDSRVLMLSLRSGAGLDGLQGVCNVALFGELDWSPGVHKQLLGRLHRPGQTSPVTGYFCVSDYGADPIMMDALDVKRIESELLVNGPEAADAGTETGTTPNQLRKLAQTVAKQ
ncbi:DEAD/DEAH box helicase [Nesterenkonia rhizosphaerae]|uniref:Helicase ATP-binding domain-containing protein n=1 Tax=Nesterenkonia rhizosphaerae TaxID=1348272 RepID=A0ABP9G6G8_9MICC